MRQYVDAPFFSKALAQLHLKDLRKQSLEWYSFNITDAKQYLFSYNKDHKTVDDNDEMDSCIPRYQLARIRHAQTFSGSYLLQVILIFLVSYLPYDKLTPSFQISREGNG